MANDFKKRTAELKPRERIEAAGSASDASAVELLAVILKTGAAGCDVMELARRLIDAFGGVEELVKTDLNTLRSGVARYNKANPDRKILGLGRVKSLELAAAFELARRGYAVRRDPKKPVLSSAEAADVFRAAAKTDAEKETFWALPLDSKKRPLSDAQVISVGTANGVSVHPRDVFAIAVRWNASAIVVAHNHPSGSPAPSKRDDELTWGLYAAGKMMGIPLVDHIVLGAKSFYSYADNTRLSQ
jgi:DNA repair protein RadC